MGCALLLLGITFACSGEGTVSDTLPVNWTTIGWLLILAAFFSGGSSCEKKS